MLLACLHVAAFPVSSYRVFSKVVAQERGKTWKVLFLAHSKTQGSLDAFWKCSPTILMSMHFTRGGAECKNILKVAVLSTKRYSLG